jgi:hypothetical protein
MVTRAAPDPGSRRSQSYENEILITSRIAVQTGHKTVIYIRYFVVSLYAPVQPASMDANQNLR